MVFVIMLAPRAFIVQKAIARKSSPPSSPTRPANTSLISPSATPRNPRTPPPASITVNARYYDHVEHLPQRAKERNARWNLLVRPRPGLTSYWHRSQSPDLLVP